MQPVILANFEWLNGTMSVEEAIRIVYASAAAIPANAVEAIDG